MFKIFTSSKLKLFLLLIINVAVAFLMSFFNLLYVYFASCLFLAILSIFFIANRPERDAYKVMVFLLIIMLPLYGIGFAFTNKENKGTKKIKKEWSDIVYRNRKTVFQSNETMDLLKNTDSEVYKTCSYIVDSIGMPCFQNAKVKYFSFGEAYFKDLFDECKKAQKFILFQCHKVVPGNIWTQLFDTLRFKAREGVTVKFIYDHEVCTKFISNDDFMKMRNHGIETIPFNTLKSSDATFLNCRNYKRLCVIDGKVGFFGGFDVNDEFVESSELTNATKDCAVKIMGESVKNLTVMFFEDYQFATKKVINLQDYFADNESSKTKDWILPYSTNPVSTEHTNKNILLSLINNSRDNITITTSYLGIDDELRNALIVNAKSGVKVRLIFSGEKVKKKYKNLARSYFYELIKGGVEVYEYKGGKMTTKLIIIDNNLCLLSTNNLDCSYTYRHFNGGVIVYGESAILMYNDMREIINNSQILTIKDLQKRKLGEKISSTWTKFMEIFK
ncbi:MAG: hypothetical protein E7345_03205 [Clostridiales bacterium]|nr:hypothetical protein [Clostridiales bacterium]